jgi:hypothetical protein
LTDPVGDTANVLREAGVSAIAPLDNQVAIVELMTDFVNRIKHHQTINISDDIIIEHSRQARTKFLAKLLAELP